MAEPRVVQALEAVLEAALEVVLRARLPGPRDKPWIKGTPCSWQYVCASPF